jgi:hypothetical protein
MPPCASGRENRLVAFIRFYEGRPLSGWPFCYCSPSPNLSPRGRGVWVVETSGVWFVYPHASIHPSGTQHAGLGAGLGDPHASLHPSAVPVRGGPLASLHPHPASPLKGEELLRHGRELAHAPVRASAVLRARLRALSIVVRCLLGGRARFDKTNRLLSMLDSRAAARPQEQHPE